MSFEMRPGECYIVRLTDRDAAVRVEGPAPEGGWVVRDLSHGRKFVVGDVDRVLGRCGDREQRDVADRTIPNRRSKAEPPVRKEPVTTAPSRVETPPGPRSLLDAAAIVLRENRRALSTREIVRLILERKLWTPTGLTPWQTLSAALHRDMAADGARSRFRKEGRGKFTSR